MDCISTQKELVDLYFTSWLTYDTTLITQLFHDTSSYIIIPRKKVLCGIEEIIAYWIRNSKRQKNIELEWETSNINEFYAFSDFSAGFYDVELNVNVHIHGTIAFVFERTHIHCLSEYYTKHITDKE